MAWIVKKLKEARNAHDSRTPTVHTSIFTLTIYIPIPHVVHLHNPFKLSFNKTKSITHCIICTYPAIVKALWNILFFATDLRTKLKLVKAGYNVLNYVGCVTWLLWLLLLDERRPDINWTRKCPNFISSLCVYQLVRILVNMMEKKQSSGLILALCLAVCMGFAASEILKSDPLTRLIPADVLRGDDTFNWFI